MAEYRNNGEYRDIPVVPLPNPGEGGPVDQGGDTPVAPLPNPGEGGPVDQGGSTPVVPLPNPGEGGPVDQGGSTPVIPLPNPGEGGPVDQGGSTPVIPLPNPGEGGPVAGGPSSSIITIFPRPIYPCFYCDINRSGNVRFLNAAVGYNPFQVYVNNNLVADTLEYAEVSEYGRVSAGSQTITVTDYNGYIYIQKQIQVTKGTSMTVAIINTASGLDLTQINDTPCLTPFNTACFRVCNLSYNSGPLNVVLNNNFVSFVDVRYKEVTPFRRIPYGGYDFQVAKYVQPMPRSNRGNILVSSFINVQPNTIYTLYIFNWNTSPDAIRTMLVEDRK